MPTIGKTVHCSALATKLSQWYREFSLYTSMDTLSNVIKLNQLGSKEFLINSYITLHTHTHIYIYKYIVLYTQIC